jgi:hypothetical protein
MCVLLRNHQPVFQNSLCSTILHPISQVWGLQFVPILTSQLPPWWEPFQGEWSGSDLHFASGEWCWALSTSSCPHWPLRWLSLEKYIWRSLVHLKLGYLSLSLSCKRFGGVFVAGLSCHSSSTRLLTQPLIVSVVNNIKFASIFCCWF